jgi:hypothetical protein
VRRLALLLALLVAAPAAAGTCREALVLALDVSGSVDATEYRQQLDGIAAALDDPAVRQAFLAMPDAPVDLAIFEWAGPGTRRLILPWTQVRDAPTLDRIGSALRAWLRRPSDPSTGLGTAMLEGAAMLAERPACWRKVLDISADGRSNAGPRPQDVRDAAALADVTVNGLVVADPSAAADGGRGSGEADLEGYFRAWVIRGPDAFVETAAGYAGYRVAMTRKLIRELQVLAIGRATVRSARRTR